MPAVRPLRRGQALCASGGPTLPVRGTGQERPPTGKVQENRPAPVQSDTSASHCPARVWRIDLDHPFPEAATKCLSGDELEQARRFRREPDRECFVRSRAVLRHLLAEQTGIRPEAIRFRVAPTGKPLLDLPGPRPELDFSVAHTEGMAVVALRLDGPVGVDVEAVPRAEDAFAAIETVLAPAELTHASWLVGEAWRGFLLRAWVAREAFAKACAMGIANLNLTRVEVPVAWVEGASRIRVPEGLEHPGGWWLHRLALGDAHVGALVTGGSTPPPTLHTWAPTATPAP